MKLILENWKRYLNKGVVEGRADFERATQNITYTSDFNDPLFAQPKSKANIEPAKQVKRAWAMAVDKIEEDEYVAGKIPSKVSQARRWIQSLQKITWMPLSFEQDIMISNLNRLLNQTDRRGEISCSLHLPDHKVEGMGGWSWLGVEVEGWVTLAADSMIALQTGYIGKVSQQQHNRFASSGTPRKPTQFDPQLGASYIFGPEDTIKLEQPETAPEALVANWKPKRIIIDYNEATADLSVWEYNKKNSIDFFIRILQNEIGLPIVDLNGRPIDFKQLAADARFSVYEDI